MDDSAVLAITATEPSSREILLEIDGDIVDTIPELTASLLLTPPTWKAEHRLWYAVIEDAIIVYTRELKRLAVARTQGKPVVYSEELTDVWDWFSSGDRHVGSFSFICEVLHIEPHAMLRNLVHSAKSQIEKRS